MKRPGFASIHEARREIKKGKILILVDSPGRENEGDFFLPAELATPQKINFMLRHGRGLVCAAMTQRKAAQLNLPLMVPPAENSEKTKVNFAVSVNARTGVGSGVSAFDRARTIRVIAGPHAKPTDLTRPGHIFSLVAAAKGLADRQGHTEAAVELARLSGFSGVGVLCEILRPNGRMARLHDLVQIGKRYKLKIVSVDDVCRYSKNLSVSKDTTATVLKTAAANLPTEYGNFRLNVYKSMLDGSEHIALLMGKVGPDPFLTRIHSQCITGDTLLSLKCDCREQLHKSMKLVKQKGRGLIIYLGQEGRGIGLTNKIRAYGWQDKGLDTVEANKVLGFEPDVRDYAVPAEILRDLGIFQIELLTNNPEKQKQLRAAGIEVVKRIPLETIPNEINKNYLEIKKEKLGHDLKII